MQSVRGVLRFMGFGMLGSYLIAYVTFCTTSYATICATASSYLITCATSYTTICATASSYLITYATRCVTNGLLKSLTSTYRNGVIEISTTYGNGDD
jgi:hypothetical protein